MELKYVVLKDGTPIIFPATHQHHEMQAIGEIDSAGFVKIYIVDKRICAATYGESASLKLRPKEDDAILIELALNKRGGE